MLIFCLCVRFRCLGRGVISCLFSGLVCFTFSFTSLVSSSVINFCFVPLPFPFPSLPNVCLSQSALCPWPESLPVYAPVYVPFMYLVPMFPSCSVPSSCVPCLRVSPVGLGYTVQQRHLLWVQIPLKWKHIQSHKNVG